MKVVATLLICLALEIAGCVKVFGGSVQLQWNASPSPAVTNYFIYVGTNSMGVYETRIPVGTNCTVTLSNIQPAHYWFAATAQNDTGGESPYSNEATWVVPSPPTGMVPVILQWGNAPGSLTNSLELFRLKIGQ